MKLERIILHGFKSFADRTQLHFHEGVTAIVGPNGSGKSNISDAVRWVLGEQKASAIRSSKMEEAIFQGTAERRRVNRAEVTLVFSNEARRLALPYDEVEVRRTVFREGGSEYQLNRNTVRLRDILDLCRDTGLGANAYAVIEQRMVDALLSDRADERRHLFEEASGIGRYKDRRKVAQRRLEAAETDLSRLDDLIGEVQSKVRSLARQKGRAERYRELRERRLALEVTIAGHELGRVGSEIEEIEGRLSRLGSDEPGTRAELATAEAELERRRLESVELSRERTTTATRLEEVTRRIAEREREVAVAEERRSHAERRLAQIEAERTELHARRASLSHSMDELEKERAERAAELEEAGGEVGEASGHQQRLREELAEVRRLELEIRERDEELNRELAAARASAAEGDARAEEAEQRLERIASERDELEAELVVLDEQGDLFETRSRELASGIEKLEGERQRLGEALSGAREAEAAVRRELADVEEQAHRTAGRVAGLTAEQRDLQGFSPAVAAALAARSELAGLAGPVADFIQTHPGRAAAMEAALGALLQALVVEEAADAETVRGWVSGREEEGVLALLPREHLPLLQELLGAMEFAGEPHGAPFLLGRRERLDELKEEAAALELRRVELGARTEEALATLERAEAGLRSLEERLRSAEHDLRQAESEESTRSGRRGRAARQRQELEERHRATVAGLEEARRSAEAAREDRARIEAELDRHRSDRAEVAGRRAERETEWEAARDHEAELRVRQARAEGAFSAAERRLADARAANEDAGRRLEGLAGEETEHRATLAAVKELRASAAAELEELFADRDRMGEELRGRDQRLADAGSATEELEREVRALRKDATARSEERHALELKRAEIESSRRSVRERIEAEWGRAFEELSASVEPLEGALETLKPELLEVAADLERLGPINMLAMEEHEEETRRLGFLTGQREDLVAARDDLQSAIRRINRAARERFEDTFERVRAHFHRTFDTLFEGGECDIWLLDPEDPLESPIEISASPRGKRTKHINLLSGGERALTSLALLFALYLVKPSPFCVLDEVDAPLDDANISRFVRMLEQFKADTQFIVVTHNPRTMEAADYIYGVTMEEPGISKIVGVQLELADGSEPVEAEPDPVSA